MDVACSLLLGLAELQGNVDEKSPCLNEAALGEILVLTISGKSLNLSEPVLSKYRRKYYISEFGEV